MSISLEQTVDLRKIVALRKKLAPPLSEQERRELLEKLNVRQLRYYVAVLSGKSRRKAACLAGYARPDTTLENYVKEIPDSVYVMVDAMYEGISGPNEKGPLLTAVAAAGGIQ